MTRDWRALLITVAACLVAGGTLALCWRFAGAGFGDVRLAAVGGLGLGHADHRSASLAVSVFAVVTLGQAAWTLLRTHDRCAHFAYGPALAAGFLVAAAF
jgi:leader peptidase (prepilin peptidase)/N-methyltransferase